MAGDPRTDTRVTLLLKLKQDPQDQMAWTDFVSHYGPKVYGWCRKWCLQEADAQDITQIVMLKLAEKMKSFSYDPTRSFRGWLRTLAHHAWSDFMASRNRHGQGSGDEEVHQLLLTAEARDDLVKHMEEQYDRELLEMASARVRMRVAPQTWDAFYLTAVEGLSGAEAAERVGMQVSQVFVAKHRVQKLLREEIQRADT